jgi:26S proteasome regulatory subunit T3
MADAAVENPANILPPHKKAFPVDSMPEIDSFEGVGANGEDEYSTLKRLQRHLEYETMLRPSKDMADKV